MPLEIVSVDRLTCRYAGSPVLDGVAFSVAAGDYIGIVGPNGSGKSTLVRTILGLHSCSEGSVTLFGTRLEQFSEWRRVGYLPQTLQHINPAFPATIEEVVALGLLAGKRFPRRRDRSDQERVEKAMELMGIADIRSKLIGQLSGGQQQRALLARALVNEPELLVMDEPTTALDPDTRERFFSLLDELHTKGTTILLVTHDTGTIGRHASRLLYIDKRVIFDGSFGDFCGSVEMTGFFGESAQHIICHRH